MLAPQQKLNCLLRRAASSAGAEIELFPSFPSLIATSTWKLLHICAPSLKLVVCGLIYREEGPVGGETASGLGFSHSALLVGTKLKLT